MISAHRPLHDRGRSGAAALPFVDLAIVLNTGRAEPGHAFAFDRALPRGQFLEGQAVAFAGFGRRQQPAVDGCDDFRLAPYDPARRIRWRQILSLESFTQGPDDRLRTGPFSLQHFMPFELVSTSPPWPRILGSKC
ncbi:hypothetical protein SPHV1_330033 [Novosphingobium sp. KN65.2]|nr:hypothetical protein SPHV1_330033 [Novosphingobium sp. KN65.2]